MYEESPLDLLSKLQKNAVQSGILALLAADLFSMTCQISLYLRKDYQITDILTKKHNMMNEETEKNSKIDIAAFITISGILLYSLGMIYWYSFFGSFKIQRSLIELTFEKIISTTWYYCVLIVAGFYGVFQNLYQQRKEEKIDVFSPIFYVIACTCFLTYSQSNTYLSFILLVVTFAIYLLIKYFIRRKNIDIEISPRRDLQYLVIIVYYLFSIFVYKHQGESHARNIINNKKQDILLTVKNENRNEIISGKLISLMSKKYFIIVNKEKQSSVLIINEDEVLKVEIK